MMHGHMNLKHAYTKFVTLIFVFLCRSLKNDKVFHSRSFILSRMSFTMRLSATLNVKPTIFCAIHKKFFNDIFINFMDNFNCNIRKFYFKN